MKKILSIVLMLSLFGAASLSAKVPQVTIVPKPTAEVVHPYAFYLGPKTTFRIENNVGALEPVAQLFAGQVEQVFGIKISTADKRSNAIRLSLQPGMEEEEYRIRFEPSHIALSAGSPAGIWYGFCTLWQLFDQSAFTCDEPLRKIAVWAVDVDDKPYFTYRGAMLDCCRHFFSVEDVKRFIDIVALHKINRFHWHLTDDQGWRIEIKRYPELTRIGSVRKESMVPVDIVERSQKPDGTPYGGYYTQQQIRDVIAYAKARFIEVVPEIEMPGHSVAALAAYNYLGCRQNKYEVRTRWGISKDVYCPGRESTFEFLENVLSEVIDLFPSKYIHIGGDECPKDRWKECPDCQQRIADNNLADEYELQSYFVRRIEGMLKQHGRNIIGWDEILEGGVSPTATVMSWRGSKGGIAAARKGNYVIMTPNTHCYLNYYQTKDPVAYKEPFGIGHYVSVEQSYALDPYDQLTPEQHKYILGVQANMWTEFLSDLPTVEYYLLPRLAAVAETGWAYDRKNYQDFKRREEAMMNIYAKLGYNFAKYQFDIEK